MGLRGSGSDRSLDDDPKSVQKFGVTRTTLGQSNLSQIVCRKSPSDGRHYDLPEFFQVGRTKLQRM